MTIEFEDNIRHQCIYFHDNNNIINNLKELNVLKAHTQEYVDLCDECFVCMTKSFPNIENLTVDFILTHTQIQQVFQFWPNLKVFNSYTRPNVMVSEIGVLQQLEILCCYRNPMLNWRYFTRTSGCSTHILANWPSMPSVKELVIGPLRMDNDNMSNDLQAFKHFIAMMPNIYCLDITFRHNKSINKFVKEMIVGWPKLTYLGIYADNLDPCRPHMLSTFAKCKNLKSLTCSSHNPSYGNYKWFFDMYKKIPSLDSIKISIAGRSPGELDPLRNRKCIDDENHTMELIDEINNYYYMKQNAYMFSRDELREAGIFLD